MIPARRDGIWRPQRISIVLQRFGKHTVRSTKKPGPRLPLRYDRETATARAKELRARGFRLDKIGLRLRKERLTPLRGGTWHPAQVAELLRSALPSDREAAARQASELRRQGMQIREIGVRLAVEGFLPMDGGIWVPSSVHALLANEGIRDRGVSECPVERRARAIYPPSRRLGSPALDISARSVK